MRYAKHAHQVLHIALLVALQAICTAEPSLDGCATCDFTLPGFSICEDYLTTLSLLCQGACRLSSLGYPRLVHLKRLRVTALSLLCQGNLVWHTN